MSEFVSTNAYERPVPSSSSNPNGISPAINGVIGAMVTLAVIVGLEAAVLFVGGFRISKRGQSEPGANPLGVVEDKAAP